MTGLGRTNDLDVIVVAHRFDRLTVTARIWDATNGRQQLKIAHTGRVWSVVFSPDGSQLATGSDDRTARIWNTTTGRQQLQVTCNYFVRAVAFSPDGTRLATGCADHNVQIWNTATGTQQLHSAHTGTVNAVAFSPDGTRLATASDDNIARVWDIALLFGSHPGFKTLASFAEASPEPQNS